MARIKLQKPRFKRPKPRATVPSASEELDDPGAGVFSLLYSRQPEVAERETRSMILFEDKDGLPAGEYLFQEAFCEGKNCDCRRVMFMVHRRDVGLRGPGQHVTTIGYGWEPLSFYLSWMRGDREGAEFMRGPMLEPNRPFFDHDVEVLRVFEKIVLPSPGYVDRVRRHYELFKAS